MTRNSFVQRAGLLICLVVLSCFLFYIGKGHTIYIDTNALTVDGKEYKSAETIEVSIDGKEAESMGRAERTMTLVGGPGHTITIEVVSGDERKVEQRFTLPTFMDSALVSVPAILAGLPEQHWVSAFVPASAEEASAEQMQHDEEPAQADEAPAKP
jgi:hypothetical protein